MPDSARHYIGIGISLVIAVVIVAVAATVGMQLPTPQPTEAGTLCNGFGGCDGVDAGQLLAPLMLIALAALILSPVKRVEPDEDE